MDPRGGHTVTWGNFTAEMGNVLTDEMVGERDQEVKESLIRYPAVRKLRKTRKIHKA